MENTRICGDALSAFERDDVIRILKGTIKDLPNVRRSYKIRERFSSDVVFLFSTTARMEAKRYYARIASFAGTIKLIEREQKIMPI